MRRPFGRRRKYGGAAVADLDGDGWPDLLCGHHGDRSIQVYFNDRNGTFSLSPFSFWRDMHGLNPFRPAPGMRGMWFVSSTGGSMGRRPRHPHVFKVFGNRSIVDVTQRSPDFVNTRRRGRSAIVMSLRVVREREVEVEEEEEGEEGNVTRVTRRERIPPPSNPDVLLLNRRDGSNQHHRAFALTDVNLPPDYNDNADSSDATSSRVSLSSPILAERPLEKRAFVQEVGKYGGVTDIDNDGAMEVILLGPFRIYKLISDFTLSDVTSTLLPRVGHSYNAALAFAELDYDNDGWFDLYVARSTSGVHRAYKLRPTLHDHLLRNVYARQHGERRYVDVTEESGAIALRDYGERPASHGVTTGDFDNDGHVDVLVVRFDGDPAYVLLRNTGFGTFQAVPGTVQTLGFDRAGDTDGDAATAVDYDRDGRIDVVLSEGSWGMDDARRGNYRVIRNVWVTGNNFLLVRVKNAPGYTVTSLHATVTVWLGRRNGDGRGDGEEEGQGEDRFGSVKGTRMIRRVGSPGTVVSNSYVEVVHFGLGKLERVRAVSVRWTDGTVRRRLNVAANKTIAFGVL